jgi:hypothetical protein
MNQMKSTYLVQVHCSCFPEQMLHRPHYDRIPGSNRRAGRLDNDTLWAAVSRSGCTVFDHCSEPSDACTGRMPEPRNGDVCVTGRHSLAVNAWD